MNRWIVYDVKNEGIFVGMVPSGEAIFTYDVDEMIKYRVNSATSFDSIEEAQDFIDMSFEESDRDTLAVMPVSTKTNAITNTELVKAGFASESVIMLFAEPTMNTTMI